LPKLARLLFAVAVFAALVLLSLSVGSGAWLWLLMAACVTLYLYGRSGAYPLLLVGALLAGASLGILLEATLRWSGAFLVSLGTAAVTAEAVEERPGHWAAIFGLAFVGLGMLVGIFDAGPTAVLVASLLVGAAVLWRLLARGR
jgi:hypothetical protein